MDNAGGVRRFQSRCDLDKRPQSMWQRHWTSGEGASQRLSGHELLCDEPDSLELSRVIDGHDVRVIQRGTHPRFSIEIRGPLGYSGAVRGEELERDLAAEMNIFGEPHFAVAPGPDQALQAVSPDQAPGQIRVPGRPYEGVRQTGYGGDGQKIIALDMGRQQSFHC